MTRAFALIVLLVAVGVAQADERAVVTITYTDGGDPILESGLKINVSHVDVKWNTRWNSEHGLRRIVWYYTWRRGYRVEGYRSAEISYESSNAELWVNKVRSTLAAEIDDQARRQGIELVMVDRDRVANRLDEQDLTVAGIAESGTGGERPKMLDVDAKIYGELHVDVKLETGDRTTIDSLRTWYRPFGWRIGAHVGLGKKQKIRRIMTLQAKFELQDAKTGRVWVTHASGEQTLDTEKPSRFFGSSKHRIDFEQPDEEIAAAFFEIATMDFLAKLLPVERSVEVVVESSRHDECEAGVAALRAREFKAALAHFREAVRKREDDHAAHFGAGVAREALGHLTAAERHYRDALRFADEEDVRGYRVALQRVEQRIKKQ